MAKTGLEYFPLDVDFFEDDKIEYVTARFHEKGELIVIKLLCAIYRNGYYTDWNEDKAIIFAKRAGQSISPSLANDVVNELVKRGFYDKNILNSFGVLTSRGIQRRFLQAVKERKEVEINMDYWLIDFPGNTKKTTFLVKQPPSKEKRPLFEESPPLFEQSKVKESKVKENNKELFCGDSDEPHKKKIIKTFTRDSVEYLASKYIADKMLEINPNAKVPKADNDFYKWCIHIDYLLRIDRKDINEMKLVLKFAMEDPFWNTVIHSTKKFREKYDQLFAKMCTKKTVSNSQSKYSKQLENLKEWADE